ncbi:hypothetical protein AQ745_14595 [Burkholderia pseudomallei]|nr:hypothetical protein AQ724_20935 [Burkholderia pseudomallei]OMR84158.1 hypothetical protein AQ732_17965 [Burkholderia pseudomallei]OMS53625.1 hypothetical protein AQ744_12650 [Burkholderia pseudomallei]OMS59094.1 hypothetical protein AQ743_21215 [Burkholderia pseudomallei]OMS68573.1 hypothetical protein AQ745_14595 [Burkholderia pseudomallei]
MFMKRTMCGASRSNRCRSGLSGIAAAIAPRSRASSPGLVRSTSRSSAPCSLPRHSSRRPLAVTRTRLQSPQKLWLCGAITPMRISPSAMRK